MTDERDRPADELTDATTASDGAMLETDVRPLRSTTRDSESHSLLGRAPGAMFYHTVSYRALLDRVVVGDPYTVVARRDGSLVGALPLFVADGVVGPVANSLPFFGTPAGPVVDGRLHDRARRRVRRQLLDALRRAASTRGWQLSTIITSHLDTRVDDDAAAYESTLPLLDRRDRIAQVVEFDPPDGLCTSSRPPADTPPDRDAADTVGEYLFTLFERRTRRAVRKSYEVGLETTRSTDVDGLYRMHVAGMEAKGGRPKPRSFFEAVPDLVPADQFDLAYATLDGQRVAGLLTFTFDGTVEYFTPAYDPEYKQTQATSRLIYDAMRDGVAGGVTRWNFGGTRPSQEGLYRFKRGWGAVEYPYRYYVSAHGDADAARQQSPATLRESYPWYYVFPYDRLDGGGAGDGAGADGDGADAGDDGTGTGGDAS